VTEDAPLIVHVGAAKVAALGTSIAVAPTITVHAGWPHWRAEIAWGGVDLGPVLRAATGGRIAGTGALSGVLAFRGDRGEVTLARGVASAGEGELQLSDAGWRARLAETARGGVAIHDRIAATLSDFTYSRFQMVFGADPIVRFAIAGRGKRIAQDLDLVVNVRSQP
jgi:hypothetical protein